MNERRRLLKMLAAGPAGAALLPLFSATGAETVWADMESCAEEALGKLPENILYTKDRQGQWKGKAGSHLPRLQVEKAGQKIQLRLATKHGMSEKHYIVRHTVVSGEGRVLGATTFHWQDKPVSEYEIALPDGDKGKELFVMSYCNLHDLWLVHTKLEI